MNKNENDQFYSKMVNATNTFLNNRTKRERRIISDVNINDDKNQETIARMIVYLFTEPRDLWITFIDFFFNSLKSESLRETLLLTSNFDTQGQYFQQTTKKILLEVLSSQLEFDFLNIDNSTFQRNVQNNKSISIRGE